jgi:hypothetical protein
MVVMNSQAMMDKNARMKDRDFFCEGRLAPGSGEEGVPVLVLEDDNKMDSILLVSLISILEIRWVSTWEEVMSI